MLFVCLCMCVELNLTCFLLAIIYAVGEEV